ncbi:phosphoribosylglycinamide formyltransferase [Roseimaritima multifibrata]|nr:phosphoribosylglycinamide formyltransferase [Roseimaritima multifibrata]
MDVPTAVLISGGGTTLKNLLAVRKEGNLPADIRLVISSSASAKGLDFATAEGIATAVVQKSKYPSDEDYSQAIFDPCRERGIGLVVMAGFLKHVLIPEDYEGRVINIHPSLIPAFCGPGMYGRRVHQAAIDKGVHFSGCTVHFVDNHYDNGPIILQRSCPVEPTDTAETLAARVFEEECLALPEAIRKIASK